MIYLIIFLIAVLYELPPEFLLESFRIFSFIKINRSQISKRAWAKISPRAIKAKVQILGKVSIGTVGPLGVC